MASDTPPAMVLTPPQASQKVPLYSFVIPATKFGAVTGTLGFVSGGLAAFARFNKTPWLFAAGSGFNCFALGSSFWAIRSTMLREYENPLKTELLYVSGSSGALTGLAMGYLLRGKSNAIPGAIVWGLAGLGGQYVFTRSQEKRQLEMMGGPPPEEPKGPGLMDRMFNTRWNPIKKLSNEEYSNMLEDRLLRVDADIAIAEEELLKLKQEAALKEAATK